MAWLQEEVENAIKNVIEDFTDALLSLINDIYDAVLHLLSAFQLQYRTLDIWSSDPQITSHG